jgi:hypothetical protein
MYIELNTEVEPITEGCFDRVTVGMECSAMLIFYIGPFKCSYRGTGYSTAECVINAIQNFLDGNFYDKPPPENEGAYWRRRGFENGIVFAGNIHPEIKTIIQNAIAIKTGTDGRTLEQTLAHDRYDHGQNR